MTSQTALPQPEPIRPARQLRALLGQGGCLLAPEAPDGLMARLVREAGFDMAFVATRGTALNRIGLPDAGLLTATELVDNAARVIGACGLPVVVDAAGGFGNAINVRRTVAELERAGAAGVMLGDGFIPPSSRAANETIDIAEMQAKLRAACDVRADPALVLVAAVQCAPLAASDEAMRHEAVRRARAWHDAGADLVFIGPLRDRIHAQAWAEALPGVPLACCLEPDATLTPADLAACGMRMAFVPDCGLLAALPAIEFTFAELARHGGIGHLRSRMADFRDFTNVAGLPGIQALEERYGVPDEQRTAL